MCPTSLYFSCGALPFPDGLGGWAGCSSAGAALRFLVGATCLELGRGRE